MSLQGHRRRRRIIDDLDVKHEEKLPLTTFVVKGDPRLLLAQFADWLQHPASWRSGAPPNQTPPRQAARSPGRQPTARDEEQHAPCRVEQTGTGWGSWRDTTVVCGVLSLAAVASASLTAGTAAARGTARRSPIRSSPHDRCAPRPKLRRHGDRCPDWDAGGFEPAPQDEDNDYVGTLTRTTRGSPPAAHAGMPPASTPCAASLTSATASRT